MRALRQLRYLLLFLAAISSAGAQNISNYFSATTLLANGWTAFSRGVPIHAIQITGQISTQAGSSNASGSIRASAAADTTNSLQVSLSSGVSSESRGAANGMYQCEWVDSDGIQHQLSFANCWQSVTWFAPSLSFETALAPTNIGVFYVGHETVGTEGVEHLRFQTIYGSTGTPASVTSAVQQASTADLYVDSGTFLPVELKYQISSDADSNVLIPVEVHYSNFAQSSNVTVPLHIEKFINGSLQQTINVSAVIVN